MKMSEDKKQLILRLPDDIFQRIKKYKDMSGVSYTNVIYNAIIWWLVMKGLMNLDDLKVSNPKKKIKIKKPTPDQLEQIEANKFCDGDSCELKPEDMIKK